MSIIENTLLLEYIETFSSDESPLLKKIELDTCASVPNPGMLSGYFQGRFLSMISTMVAPGTILEIGTYMGYSALCLAEGLAPKGRLITLDNNEALATRTRNYLVQSDFASVIDYRVGDAKKIIPTLPHTVFDLVFIDADKQSYPIYYDMVIDRVPVGGYILADNVLWKGKVANWDALKKDKIARSMDNFNNRVNRDKRVENLLLPIRDGLMVMRKK